MVGGIQKLESRNRRLTLLRSCAPGLRCVEAGLGCLGGFGEMAARSHFRPTEGAVLARSAFPSACRTFH